MPLCMFMGVSLWSSIQMNKFFNITLLDPHIKLDHVGACIDV